MDLLRRLFSRPEPAVDAGVQDAPGTSLHALARKRAEAGCELMAHVYLYADARFIATSVMWVPGSVILEIGEPSVLPVDASNADLGRAVCEHLLAHDARQPPNLRDHKATDWAAYRASGARSVSGFETKSWQVTVETINGVLTVEANPVRTREPQISVRGVVAPMHEELGATIRRVLSAADVLRHAGFA